jgi:hypothetical protein
MDITLIKANDRVWHKSYMKKGVVLQVLIPMHGGAIVIPRNGYLDINYI